MPRIYGEVVTDMVIDVHMGDQLRDATLDGGRDRRDGLVHKLTGRHAARFEKSCFDIEGKIKSRSAKRPWSETGPEY
jgi:hypothetical protein